MSYKYARIPLSSGLNVVCGPNGSGKSSILLAISVALGQAYTERGQKLSDLIRWGEDSARVTLVFNKISRSEFKPIPKLDNDFFSVSRYLNKDNNYWFEINSQTVHKSEVTGILGELGINPDNMLIIMHQHMMMEFGVTTPQKKLLMVEEAVGIKEYRHHILEAHEKLTQVLSEEESISSLLKNAEQTLVYWKDEYEKYQRRKELLLKKNLFERELAWAQLIRQEKTIEMWKNKIWKKENELTQKAKDAEENETITNELKEDLKQLNANQQKLYDVLLALEKEKVETEEIIRSLNHTQSNIEDYTNKILDGCPFQNDDNDFVATDSKTENFETSYKDAKIRSDTFLKSTKLLEKKLNDLRLQIQLLKQDANTLGYEKTLLDTMNQDKEVKEQTLRQCRKKHDEISQISDQVGLQLTALHNVKKEITQAEAQKNSLLRELNRLIDGLPSIVKIEPSENLTELAKEVLHKLQSEIETRKKIKEQIEEADTLIQTLREEQQIITTEIQLCENELEKFRKQSSDIQLCLEGKMNKPNIRCELCGSILPPDKWTDHLKEITDQIQSAENKTFTLKNRLKKIQEDISNNQDEKAHLYQEERILEVIHPASIQASQLFDDITTSNDILQKKLNERKQIIKSLAELIEINETSPQLDQIIEKKAKDIQTEADTLKHEIPRLVNELYNIENFHIKTQLERVNKAKKASENYQTILPKITKDLKQYNAETLSQLQFIDQRKLELKDKMSATQAEFEQIKDKLDELNNHYQDANAKTILLKFQIENVRNEIEELKKEQRKAHQELIQLQPPVETMGNRIETERNSAEISADIKIVQAHLTLLKDVSEDVEKMYKSYLSIFNELKEKAHIVSENRNKALTEVDDRKHVWKNFLDSLIDKVNPTFDAFLEKIKATGRVRLINAQDFEAAGLELIVGFKGAKPHVLDSRTHSGGERSSATMAFLLALQRHVRSPFRAVDEFDVHMDPRNREAISLMLLMEMENEAMSQYLTITPGQLTNVRDDVHVITVQRIQDISEIKVMTQTSQSISEGPIQKIML